MDSSDQKFDAWNPGLSSTIPPRLWPLVSLFRPENGIVDYAAAKEAADFCGLHPVDMAALKLERLIAHELLIRVTADLSVPDGPNYEELGLNLRGMVACINETYVVPHLDELNAKFVALKAAVANFARTVLDEHVFARPVDAPEKPGFFARLTGQKVAAPLPEPTPQDILEIWRSQMETDHDPLRNAVLKSLIRVVGGHIGKRGRIMADADILTRFATNMCMNGYGSTKVGEWIEPIFAEAARSENYRFLPAQPKPFFMNVKGASASGKSTIRPQQRALAEKLGIPWEDFALISPDYWRKYLLDYDSLGPDYKFGAMMTGQELEIIDKKLDAYVEAKAQNKNIPHLLIDRFRFDSFSTDAEGKISSRLLTRFGDTVFLFFLITPPAETVERAWKRGLETGRYKAVDDLLFHNIEAYTGMPQLFFSWLGSARKNIHFEFLDNDVPLGQRPRTVAYGWNDTMTILDVECLHNIDRFRAVNVDATQPEDVLGIPPELTFFDRCVGNFQTLKIVDPRSRAVTAQALGGAWQDTPSSDKISDADVAQALTLGSWT